MKFGNEMLKSVICKYMATMNENIKFGKFDPI